MESIGKQSGLFDGVGLLPRTCLFGLHSVTKIEPTFLDALLFVQAFWMCVCVCVCLPLPLTFVSLLSN